MFIQIDGTVFAVSVNWQPAESKKTRKKTSSFCGRRVGTCTSQFGHGTEVCSYNEHVKEREHGICMSMCAVTYVDFCVSAFGGKI